ncbi:hypothetical protein QF047_003482 [Arthrobacter sp. W4I7]|nr:hypothetical protein [Arthrobacter sp. W4I7]
MTLRFAGYLHLPMPLQVSPEVLGLSYNCLIEGASVTITFPVLAPGGDIGARLEPPYPSQRWEYTRSWDQDGESPWGRVSISLVSQDGSRVRIRAVGVAGLAFRADCPNWGQDMKTVEVGVRFGQLFEPWYGLARQWFELWTPQDLVNRELSLHPEGQLWLDDENGAVQMLTGWRGPLGPVQLLGDDQVLTSDAVTSGFDRASAGEAPPLEWLLYMNASRNKDRRQSVIEAASAAEVAAQTAFAEKLGNDISDDVVQLLITQANGLVGLTNVVRGFGLEVPSKNAIQEKLAKVRNMAAHRGVTPEEEEYRAALGVARDIISATSPMPLPAGSYAREVPGVS